MLVSARSITPDWTVLRFVAGLRTVVSRFDGTGLEGKPFNAAIGFGLVFGATTGLALATSTGLVFVAATALVLTAAFAAGIREEIFFLVMMLTLNGCKGGLKFSRWGLMV